jgi:Asp/Glu/hydantoin racemase
MTQIKTQPGPRIALIHALEESVAPIRASFRDHWPEAFTFDLLDTSLAIDRAHAGVLDGSMMRRFTTLADYAAGTEGLGGQTRGILFTCSAFGPAIDAVKARMRIPVLRPNESAFEQALAIGNEIGLIVSFLPSEASLRIELEQMARAASRSVRVRTVLAEGALDALKANDGPRHDALVAEAARSLGDVEVVVLGQFSMARAAAKVRQRVSAPVLTTPDCAVQALRALITTSPAA